MVKILFDLHGITVKDSKCEKIDDEKYYSTCFLTPKNISVKGVRNPEKCKILYKAELDCVSQDGTVEPFVKIVPIDGTPCEYSYNNALHNYSNSFTNSFLISLKYA